MSADTLLSGRPLEAPLTMLRKSSVTAESAIDTNNVRWTITKLAVLFEL